MTAELVFYTNPMSRGRIARWMLEETGQPYRTEFLDFGPAMKTPDYLALNPMGKVPTLKHGDTVVTETAAICAYLADAFPEAGLAPPPGDPSRGAYYRWLFFAAGPLETAVLVKALSLQVPPERKGLAGFGTYEDVMAALDHVLSKNDFVAGDRFSAADVYLGAQISWGLQFSTIEKRPSFIRYWDRLKDRPAHVRASELDDRRLAEAKTKPS